MALTDTYRIFYWRKATNDYVPGENPVSHQLDTIIDMSMQLLQDGGDSFGIVDDQDHCIQFVVDAMERVEIDIPDPARRGSHRMSIGLREIEGTVKDIARLFAGQRTGFTFVSW